MPLENLADLLVTPNAHLITLSDPFVGYVLPSKVHACIESRLPVFIGSPRSDVHRLCIEHMRAPYIRVDQGDIASCAEAPDRLAGMIDLERSLVLKS